ncbi:MAG: protein kinase [Gammaproteobacteria bacterium]|nr:protein kinase [Gammaproteobacteria bacterium]
MRILNEGTRLADRYTLNRRLGAGGMSEVWLAADRSTQTTVALKFLAAEAAGDVRQKDRLQREWQIGSRLMHPNIIRVFEFHDDPEAAYFALQFVGETDIGVLAGSNPAESMRPVGLIADALRYAHGKNVIHRDIKAANVLLDSRGVPYLVDFGVAASEGSEVVAGSGSDIAMSPEQRAGGAARAADDIFALGVLMHELLTGMPPGGQEHRDVATHLPDGSPVPTALFALINDMLQADPSARPDAASVAARLTKAGYAAGTAPARFVRGESAAAEVFESIESARTLRNKPTVQNVPEQQSRASQGISPTLLYGGLGAALVLFLAVIFVLPKMVARDGSVPVTGDTEMIGVPADPLAPQDPGETPVTVPAGNTSFSENLGGIGGTKVETDDALGDLLSRLERLRYRAIDRWGGQEYLDAVDVYNEGDQAYVDRNYRLAGEKYRQAGRMLEPFFDRIDEVFTETLASAEAAFERGDAPEAVRLYDLAASITPGNREAEAGLLRAQNLDSVLSLMDQGTQFENDLELDAARQAYAQALEIDALWEPAAAALARVKIAINNLSFEQRMTEGFEALSLGEFDSARAAFNAAKLLNPGSREPTDGLLQLDQEVRLADIRRLESEALSHDSAEEWETSILVYQDILKIDGDLQFAQEGLSNARSRAALHSRLQAYIDDPDNLSEPANMQNATQLLLEITRIQPMGPRLEDQKTELSRLLKRAATPLLVELVSDNATQVSLFKIGQFGMFANRQVELLPGNYVAVGIRPGYRDVRVEFRVAPEIDMQPIVVQCEEQI